MPDIHPRSRHNAKQAAALLGISRETLRKCVKAGIIRPRYSKLSSRPYYLGGDIQALWRNY